MSYLLDTCVVSELSRPRPDPGVLAWMLETDVFSLHLSAMTIGEVRRGTLRLPVGKRRTSLAGWSEKLRQSFSGRVLPIDESVALRWAEIAARAEQAGRPGSLADGLIAATALDRGLTLVTRNVTDFEALGVSFLNPWTAT
ncbi:MAG: type II toxin-antitoxin system VapC family toxin [Burkholderiales bacterium]